MRGTDRKVRRIKHLSSESWTRWIIGVLFVAFVLWRLGTVLFVDRAYGADTWVRFAISGVVLGSVYAVIALGYTLVYGILFMINFAHGDVMMLGAFAGYFSSPLRLLSPLGRWCPR